MLKDKTSVHSTVLGTTATVVCHLIAGVGGLIGLEARAMERLSDAWTM